MLLLRTAIILFNPAAEVGGIARVFQRSGQVIMRWWRHRTSTTTDFGRQYLCGMD